VLPACHGHGPGEVEQELLPWWRPGVAEIDIWDYSCLCHRGRPGDAELDRWFEGFLVEFARLRPEVNISQVYQTIDLHLPREACAARELVSYARHTEEG
jgi:hypothetical protein